LSPVASGLCASALYFVTYHCVLKWKEESFRNSKIFFPFVVAFTIGLNVVFMILKGASGQKEALGTEDMVSEAKDGDMSKVLVVGAIAAAIAFVITAAFIPHLTKRVEADVLQLEVEAANEEKISKETEMPKIGTSVDDKSETAEQSLEANGEGNIVNNVISSVSAELRQDVYASVKTDEVVGAIHENVERHDVRTEEMFKYVQVFTAVVDSFSHGANDVANAMGPFAAVYLTHKNGYVAEKDDVGDDMYWILALGGLGIGIGLSTYGYKIMLAIGVKLAAITPSRGFCIELGAAFVIIFGTTQGWPLSTTHCQVGATVGVGMFEGRGGVNWWIFAKCIIGWVVTLVIAGFTAALLVGPSPDPAKSEYC